MTLKYMQGFETIRDDTDLRAQGWLPRSGSPTIKTSVASPSVTNIPGWSLRATNAPQSLLYSIAPWGSTSEAGFGYLNTGMTVNQTWQAGGITLGFGAKFNSGVNATYGAGNQSAAIYDGSLYWAICGASNMTTFSVASSPDLQNWTVAPSGGLTTALSANSCISNMGGGVLAVTPDGGAVAGPTAFYSNNNGATWTSYQFFTQGFFTGTATGCGIATGNSSFPHLYICAISSTTGNSSQAAGIYVGQFGGSWTNVLSLGNISGFSYTAQTTPRVIGNLVVAALSNANNGQKLYSCAQSGIGTPANWVTTTLPTSLRQLYDFVYHQASNLWILATPNGINTFANSGAAGTPTLTATTIATLSNPYSANAIYKLFITSNGNVVGIGATGVVVTSSDGVNWTAVKHLLNDQTTSYLWYNGVYDGNRYVLFSNYASQFNGIIATTPDLQTNFQAAYVPDQVEIATSLGSGLTGGGLIASTAAPTANGQFTPNTSGGGFLYLVVANAVSGSRNFAIYDSVNRSTTYITGSISTSTLYHYFELRYVAVAGSPNKFNVFLYVDGVQVGSTLNYQFVTAADTTSVFLVGMQRNGALTAYDDFYITTEDGQGLSGNLGIINIVAQRPTTDVQAQWVKNGSAASNALSVNQPALSSSSANFISSSNSGDKDLYTTTDTIPAGYSAKAVLVESYFTKTSTSQPTVNVGIKSGSSELDSTNVALTTTGVAQYVSVIADKDPNGNGPWTNSAVMAAQFVENHIT